MSAPKLSKRHRRAQTNSLKGLKLASGTHRLGRGRCPQLGQKRTWRHLSGMSALPPKADIRRLGCNVGLVP